MSKINYPFVWLMINPQWIIYIISVLYRLMAADIFKKIEIDIDQHIFDKSGCLIAFHIISQKLDVGKLKKH